MRGRSVIILGALVAALGAFVYFTEQEPSPGPARRLVAFEPDTVLSLVIERPGLAAVKLERQGGSPACWRMTEPEPHRADGLAVDGLLRALAELESKRTIEDAAPADLGLDAPRLKLGWTTAGGSDTLLLGAEVPASGDTLVGLESRPGLAFVTAGSMVGELQRDAASWRDRRLFPGDRAAIERIRVIAQGGAPRVVLARHGESFRITEPFDDQAEKNLVEGLLGELTALSAQSFLAPPTAFEPSGGAIEVAFNDGSPLFTLELGTATAPAEGTPLVVRTRAGAEGAEGAEVEAARIVTRLAETAALAPERWRSSAWTSLASYDISVAVVTGAGGTVTLKRDGVDWQRGAEKISYTEVSDFLAAITAAAGGFLPPADESFSTALTIELAGPKEAREILVLRGRRATNSARPGVVLGLSQEAADEVRKTLDRVKAAKPEEG